MLYFAWMDGLTAFDLFKGDELWGLFLLGFLPFPFFVSHQALGSIIDWVWCFIIGTIAG